MVAGIWRFEVTLKKRIFIYSVYIAPQALGCCCPAFSNTILFLQDEVQEEAKPEMIIMFIGKEASFSGFDF